MSTISSPGKTRSRTAADRILKVAAMLLLPLLVVAVAACDSNNPSPTATVPVIVPVITATVPVTGTMTNSRAPYEGVPEGKPRYTTANQPDIPEALETTAPGQLPSFALAAQGSARDKVIAGYTGAAAHFADYSNIPCYCGCAMYQHPHTSLASCYVKEVKGDGQIVFTDHGTTCEVCQGVAGMAVDGLASNRPLADIRADVFKKFKYTGTWTDTPLN